MKLMTKEIEKKLPPLYSTEGERVKKVIVKFFCPWSNWTWYVFEGEKREDGDWEFFGMVHGVEKEMGNFVLSELQSVTGPAGLKIERDIHYTDVYMDTSVRGGKTVDKPAKGKPKTYSHVFNVSFSVESGSGHSEVSDEELLIALRLRIDKLEDERFNTNVSIREAFSHEETVEVSDDRT